MKLRRRTCTLRLIRSSSYSMLLVSSGCSDACMGQIFAASHRSARTKKRACAQKCPRARQDCFTAHQYTRIDEDSRRGRTLGRAEVSSLIRRATGFSGSRVQLKVVWAWTMPGAGCMKEPTCCVDKVYRGPNSELETQKELA